MFYEKDFRWSSAAHAKPSSFSTATKPFFSSKVSDAAYASFTSRASADTLANVAFVDFRPAFREPKVK